PIQGCSHRYYTGRSTPVRPTCPAPTPDSFPVLSVVDATYEHGDVFTIIEEANATSEAGQEAAGGTVSGTTGGAAAVKVPTKGKRKSSGKATVKSRRDDTETELFDEYLLSEISKNKAMTILLGNKNRKVLLEIEKLEQDLD
ncbi:hypothetical protein LSAT2_026533, partial [Lamellibrachia satsuma]